MGSDTETYTVTVRALAATYWGPDGLPSALPPRLVEGSLIEIGVNDERGDCVALLVREAEADDDPVSRAVSELAVCGWKVIGELGPEWGLAESPVEGEAGHGVPIVVKGTVRRIVVWFRGRRPRHLTYEHGHCNRKGGPR